MPCLIYRFNLPTIYFPNPPRASETYFPLFFGLEDSCHERAFVNDWISANSEEESVAWRDDTTEYLSFERRYYLTYLIACLDHVALGHVG